MRHGRKSKRFNGYKEHIAADLDSELILACAVTPANGVRSRSHALQAHEPHQALHTLAVDLFASTPFHWSDIYLERREDDVFEAQEHSIDGHSKR